MILAHRGDTQNYSPNTKESVMSALEKCGGVELDLNLSSDGVFYFYHETDWTRRLLARRYTLGQVLYGVPNGESLLTLHQALQLVKQANKHLLLHAEIGGGGYRWALDFNTWEMQDILGIIRNSGIDKELVLFHTVSPSKAKELDGHIVFHRLPVVLRKDYGMYRFAALKAILCDVHPATTMAYVINDWAEFQILKDAGVGYILTDRLFDGAC